MCTPNAPSDKSSLRATSTKTPRRAATSGTTSAKVVSFSSKEADQMLVQTRSELKETGQEKEVWYTTEELIKINLESLQTASLMKQYVLFVAAQNQSSGEQAQAQEQEVPVEQCCLQLPQNVLDMLEETCFGGHASRGIFYLCDEGSRRRKKLNQADVVSRVLKQQAEHPLNNDNVHAICKVARGSSRKARAMAHLRGVMDQLAARSAEGAVAVAEPKTDLKRTFSEIKSTAVEDTVLDSTPWKKSRMEAPSPSITGAGQA
jgi:hypothetical protein